MSLSGRRRAILESARRRLSGFGLLVAHGLRCELDLL